MALRLKMRLVAALVIATFCGAANLLATAVEMQALSAPIFPRNSALPNCPMLSAHGGFTTTYSTAAAENNTFLFDDFLPPSAVLAYVSVSLSILGDGCATSNTFAVYLNQGFPGVDPYSTTIGTDYAAGDDMRSCQTPAQFEETGRVSPALLTPDIAPYVRGGTNAITVVEQPTGSCSAFIEYVVVTLSYYDGNLPVVGFDLSAASSEDQRKVLMHRWRSETAYPYLSSFQVAAAQNDTGRDGHIQVSATVTDASGIPLSGMDLYVRVVDPPDPSTYLPAGESRWGDNPYGYFAFTIPWAPNTPDYGWQPVTSDGAGRISLPLPVGGQGIPSFMPAGDNVQVQASAIFLPFISPGRCTAAVGCYASGVITSWRRVYIERDRMFKAGAFLTGNAVHGTTILDVTSISAFSNASTNNPIAAVLIHGHSRSALSPQNYMETVLVKKAAGTKLTLTQPLRYDYFAVRSSVDPSLWAGDAIGKYASDADLFPTDLSLAVDFFGAKFWQNPPACDSLYTDFMVLAEGSAGPNPPLAPNMVPYIPFVSACTPTLAYCLEVAERFFDSRSGRQTLPGHQHFISSAADSPDIQHWTAALGNTCKDADGICGNSGAAGTVLIYDVAIGWTGLSLTPMLQEISAHELAHTFDVNQANAPDYGHCTAQQPQPGGPMASNQTGHCLMNGNRTNAERTDSRIGFHVSPWETSEYRRIRARPDPIPETWQSTFNPNP